MAEDFKGLLNKALPSQIITVFESYREFMATPAPEEAKAFANYHAGAKNALYHIWMLVRLLSLTEEAKEDNQLETLIEKARNALNTNGENDELPIDID